MAPEHLHPQSAYDCFKVYSFLVEHLHKYMRIRPKNIFIAGDASGGSVACSLTALILK
jgi:acetyl esterase/lipase